MLQREAIERKCARMEEEITILLDGRTVKYILKVDAQFHHSICVYQIYYIRGTQRKLQQFVI